LPRLKTIYLASLWYSAQHSLDACSVKAAKGSFTPDLAWCIAALQCSAMKIENSSVKAAMYGAQHCAALQHCAGSNVKQP